MKHNPPKTVSPINKRKTLGDYLAETASVGATSVGSVASGPVLGKRERPSSFLGKRKGVVKKKREKRA